MTNASLDISRSQENIYDDTLRSESGTFIRVKWAAPTWPTWPTWPQVGPLGPFGPLGPLGPFGPLDHKYAHLAHLTPSTPTWPTWPIWPSWPQVGQMGQVGLLGLQVGPGGQLRQDLDCFGTYATHAPTCDNVRVQVGQMGQVGQVGLLGANLGWNGPSGPSGPTWGVEWASGPTWGQVDPGGQLRGLLGVKCAQVRWAAAARLGLLRYILYTCPNLWWRSCSKCHAMDCFGTYSTHAQTCDDVLVRSATEWTASVHTLHMPKPVMTFVLKVRRNGLLRYILYTCPSLWWRSWSKCHGMDCFGTYSTHVQA